MRCDFDVFFLELQNILNRFIIRLSSYGHFFSNRFQEKIERFKIMANQLLKTDHLNRLKISTGISASLNKLIIVEYLGPKQAPPWGCLFMMYKCTQRGISFPSLVCGLASPSVNGGSWPPPPTPTNNHTAWLTAFEEGSDES